VTDTLLENRLRWLCRRGMLELDTWLTRFFDRRFSALTPDQRATFARLLEQDDLSLFDWLSGEREPPDEFHRMVDEIRTTRILT